MCIVFMIGACESGTIEATDPADRTQYAVEVIIEPVRFEQQSTRFDAIGTGRANRSVILFPDAAGEVVERNFEAGQRVATGDILLRLEDRDERLAVELGEVRLKDAQRLLERYQRAQGNAAILPTTIDTAATAVETTRIELERARVALDRRRILAPFSGYVGISDIEIGDRVTTSTQVTTLDDRDTLLIRLDVPEAVSGQIRTGDTLTVSSWSQNGTTRPATVVDIGSRIDPVSRTFTIQARVDNTDDALRPGMGFRVLLDILGGTYPVVPEVAVQWGADGAYVWRSQAGRAEQVSVGIVQRRTGDILVDGALQAGDRIVVEGVQRVRDGVRLRDAAKAQEAG